MPADLGGTPSVVVGDRRGYLYAYALATGDPIAGWPATNGSGPIDSTPSVVNTSGQVSSILVGSGNDEDPTTGGYQAYGPTGHQEWFAAPVNPPSDTSPAVGVQAGISVGTLAGADGSRRRFARPGLLRPQCGERFPAQGLALPQYR